MKRRFRRLFPAIYSVCFLIIGFRCLNETKKFHHVYRDNFLAALSRGYSALHFERGEDPEDEVALTYVYFFVRVIEHGNQKVQ